MRVAARRRRVLRRATATASGQHDSTMSRAQRQLSRSDQVAEAQSTEAAYMVWLVAKTRPGQPHDRLLLEHLI